MRRRKPYTTPDVHNRSDVDNPAAVYVRVSTEEQANKGVSLAAQLERISAYALMTGLTVVRTISEDGVSGAKKLDTRPGGTELSGAVDRGEIRHIIALKLDRLFRDAEDALGQTRRWDKAGVALHVIDMGGSALNTASAMGRMFLTMTAAFAELERNLISERTSTALGHKKKHLEAYGPTPVGYRREGNTLISDEAELAIVAQLKEWDRAEWPFRKMADELTARGIPTKRGGKRWYASTVSQILANDLHD
jgi:site-specific DNA recombinase